MSRSPKSRRSILPLSVLAFALAVGCSSTGSSGGSGGCAALQPIPAGRYSGPKTDNAVSIRLSANGINYLNSNWRQLIEQFAPGQKLNISVPCTPQSSPVGNIWLADQGKANCTPSSNDPDDHERDCGRHDGTCSATDVPKAVVLNFTGFQLVPRSPDTVEVVLSATVNTGTINVRLARGCFGFGHADCGVVFNTASALPSANTLKVRIKFTIDTKWDKLLSFDVSQLDGTQICGASGAPGKPVCLDPDDLAITAIGHCDTVCNGADIDFVKETVLKLISPILQDQIDAAVGKQRCEQCGLGKPPCPTVGTAVSSCNSDKVCMDGATGKCVPRFLGVEGRVSPGTLLANFGIPAEAQLDLSVAAGSSVGVNTGVNLAMRAGVKAVTVASCVPALAAPPTVAVPAPNFDTDATAGSPYHVGLGLSQPFLNQALFQAQQSGTFCLGISSAQFGVLNTGLFKTFLPSLGRLATRDGKDAPMLIVMRPTAAPQVKVGQGTYDPVTKKPIKPLLTLSMPDLSIDFYAMVDDRFVRLFSLTADISLPLSVIFEGCSSVQPALGNLGELITNIRTSNSEMLAEDPKLLADLIPAVIGLAEPAVAGALKPFALPAVGNFKLKVNETKGINKQPGTENYFHLGIYAQLMGATATCAGGAPTTEAFIKSSQIPAAGEMRLQGKPLPWPTAVIDVRQVGVAGTPEFAWRVDLGLWTDFVAAPVGELVVSHPGFLLQGRHLIEVRSRTAEDPHGVSSPVQLSFLVDWDAPEVRLDVDRDQDLLTVFAADAVSPDEKLQFAYRVGEGAWSDFGPGRPIDLAAIEAAGGMEVRVRDEAGNVGSARHALAAVDYRDGAIASDQAGPSEAVGSQAAGCSAALASPGLFGFAALLLLARRRRQS